MNILIAPNAFKNSATAPLAAQAIRDGLIRSSPEYTCTCFPIGDGGDGTAGLLIERLQGRSIQAQIKDPLGRSISALFGLIEEGKAAVIEMADASGLRLLKTDELNPLQASSYGSGQLMRMALDQGVKKIILCMGGSATVDGGTGILHALGIRFYRSGQEIQEVCPINLSGMDDIDTSLLDPRMANTELVILCDVDNALLGSAGSAAVFGPQKGASVEDVVQLEKVLSEFSALALKKTGKDMAAITYGGTAGGAAAGLWTYLNAKLVNGIEYFLDITGFDQALQTCDVVITGEGSIDEQTLQGKGPYGVARRAKLNNKAVIGLAGKLPLPESENLYPYFDVLLAIGHSPASIEDAIKNTLENLERTAFQIGNLWKVTSLPGSLL